MLTMNQSSNISSVQTGQPSSGNVLVTSLLSAALLAICMLGVAGNIYTMVVTCSASMQRATSMYVYILNLALADLLYLSTIPFVVGTYMAHDWLFGEVGCRVLLSLDLFTMHASIFVLAAMSLERYRAVASPFSARHSSTRTHKLVALAIWAASFLLTLPMMLMIRLRQDRPGPSGCAKRICFPTWTLEAFRAYLSVLFFTSILGPGLFIVSLYARLVKHYWVAQAKLGCSNRRARQAGLRQKVVLTIFCIILAYWACFLPFWVWQLARLFSPSTFHSLSSTAHTYVNFTVTCLTYGNSCVNPLLYTLLTRNYKDYLAQKCRTTGSSCGEAAGTA